MHFLEECKEKFENYSIEEAVGWENAADLKSALATPVPSYLLVGKEPYNKYAAYWLAHKLASNEESGSPLPTQENPDITILDSVGRSISVKDVRNALQDFSLSPISSSNKVMVVLKADKSPLATPAFLKSVEDSNSNFYIFAIGKVENHLDTLASRSVIIKIKGQSLEIVPDYLEAVGARISEDERSGIWLEALKNLDGSGHAVWASAKSIIDLLDRMEEGVKKQLAVEKKQLSADKKIYGEIEMSSNDLEKESKQRMSYIKNMELSSGIDILWAQLKKTSMGDAAYMLKMGKVMENAKSAIMKTTNLKLVLWNLFLEVDPGR